jgi:hypothetical protein
MLIPFAELPSSGAEDSKTVTGVYGEPSKAMGNIERITLYPLQAKLLLSVVLEIITRQIRIIGL